MGPSLLLVWCAGILRWCGDNNSRLGGINSRLGRPYSRLGWLREFTRKVVIWLYFFVARRCFSRKIEKIPGSTGKIGNLATRSGRGKTARCRSKEIARQRDRQRSYRSSVPRSCRHGHGQRRRPHPGSPTRDREQAASREGSAGGPSTPKFAPPDGKSRGRAAFCAPARG